MSKTQKNWNKIWLHLSREGEDSHADTDDRSYDDGQGLEQLIEVILAQVGAEVVDEAVDLAQAEDTKRLECKIINLKSNHF